MEEVEDEPLFASGSPGSTSARPRSWSPSGCPATTRRGRRQQETRQFGTTRRELLALADWLRAWQVQRRPGWRRPATTGSRCTSCWSARGSTACCITPSQVKALPGRPKTDKLDSAWLARITERGSAAGSSFVPPEDIRRLRTHTRYRRQLTQARTAEKAARGEAAGGRAPEAVLGDQRHPRRLRPGHAARDHRRGAQPRGAGADGPRPGCAARSAQLEEALDCSFFTERARLRPGDDAGQHRPPHRPDRGAGREDRACCASRTSARSPSWTASPASGSSPPRTSSARSAWT